MTLILLALLAAAATGGAFYYANKRELNNLEIPKPETVLDTVTDVVPTPEPVATTTETTVQETEAPVAKPPRTRAARGRFKADDPATPEVNEAFVGGVSPKKLRKLPADYELEAMKKSEIAELALERGLAMDLKKTKVQMIEELKAFKPARARKQ